jgi:probable rRNA maturation factor
VRADANRLRIEMQRRVQSWSPARGDIARWASVALGRRGAGYELSVRVVGAAESRRLNSKFRGKDRPTNVLSFPAAPITRRSRASPSGPPYRALSGIPGSPASVTRPLGDLVICPQVLRAEAREQQKSLRAHWAHLVVHGALHLIGYDHERQAEASRMERREIRVLRSLGFANPYRSS